MQPMMPDSMMAKMSAYSGGLVSSSVDLLYLALAVGFIVLVIFLSITLMYTIFILRDVNKVIDNTKEITEKVNEYIISPVKIITMVANAVKPIIGAIQEKTTRSRKR